MIRYGLVARIAGFHPAGPGSIPGTGAEHASQLFLFFFDNIISGDQKSSETLTFTDFDR